MPHQAPHAPDQYPGDANYTLGPDDALWMADDTDPGAAAHTVVGRTIIAHFAGWRGRARVNTIAAVVTGVSDSVVEGHAERRVWHTSAGNLHGPRDFAALHP